jgi:tripartite ATP-independent transporter DctP family solute receptor
MRVIKAFAVVLFILLLNTGCMQENRAKIIRLGHGLDTGHPVHKGMEFLAKRLAEKSGNTVKIQIYPSEQLGTERQCVELLQIGSLGMTKVSAGVLENFAPGMRVFGVPFLFDDRAHGHRVLDAQVGKDLLAESEKYWLRGLTFYDAGSRSFYTKSRPVNHPDDLAGLKVRVMESASSIKMVRSLGGSPTPIAWGELYTALQQGIVDGAENNPPSFYLSRHYEVCKYYIIDEHTMLPDVLVMSTVVWESLTEQEQTWLMEAVQESVIEQRKLWKEAEAHALAEVQKAGVQILYPDKEPFRAKVTELTAQYMQDAQMSAFIKQIKALSNEATN